EKGWASSRRRASACDRLDGRHARAACRNGRDERYPRREASRIGRVRLMATTEEAPAAEQATVAWYALTPEEVTSRIGVGPPQGLSAAGAPRRLAGRGPNKSAVAEAEPGWRAFVRQYRDPMQIVLLVAGIGSLYPLKELGTGLVLLFLTLFNAVLGLRQEGKAAEAVAALQKMMIVKARVRRDGQLAQIPAEELVPGDIVSIEAGDVVAAGRRTPFA